MDKFFKSISIISIILAVIIAVEDKYRRKGPWENLWFSNTDDFETVLIMGDDIWEVADIRLEDNADVFIEVKISDDEYEYYTSFYNGGCGLIEAIEYGFEDALKKDKS